MLLSIQSIIHSIAEACEAVAGFLGGLCLGIVFVVCFAAFALGEALGVGKVD